MRSILSASLIDAGILGSVADPAPPAPFTPVIATNSSLTFEQQKELLLLQHDHDRAKQAKELEVKLQLERERLELIREGKVGGEYTFDAGSDSGKDRPVNSFDLGSDLRLVPKFNENDPDTFFLLFERVADSRGWPGSDRVLLLQCVVTGRAQEAYSALSATDCQDYVTVKNVILRAYELVPEAYRARFRTLRRGDRQPHVDFARELLTQFNRWCSASDVASFEDLCHLVVSEQFKESVPERLAVYLAEQSEYRL